MPMGAEANPTDGGKKPNYNPNDYVPFGENAQMAHEQGWMPITSNGGAVTYRNQYAPAFNGVMIDNKPTGHLEIVGNKNGLFDVRIANEDGKVHKVIMTGQPFSQVDDYFRNNKSIIQQRMNRVQQDQNNNQPYNGIAWAQ